MKKSAPFQSISFIILILFMIGTFLPRLAFAEPIHSHLTHSILTPHNPDAAHSGTSLPFKDKARENKIEDICGDEKEKESENLPWELLLYWQHQILNATLSTALASPPVPDALNSPLKQPRYLAHRAILI